MPIKELLEKYGQPRAMVVRPDDETGWMTPLAGQAFMWCRTANASFAILEDGRMQAVAIQDGQKFVGVYAGMFWILCRLASLVVERGMFPTMLGGADPVWSPELQRSLQTPRELLEETQPYKWEIESINWRDGDDRQVLFYHVLSVLFRFVVFHEIGHLNNDHQLRRKPGGSEHISIDRLGPKLIDPEEAIPSQAREIIADASAMHMTMLTLKSDLDAHPDEKLVRITRSRLLANDVEIVVFVLTIINLYFRCADRSDWREVPLDRLSHPPAPFRMKAIYAYVLETLPLGVTKDQADQAIQTALVASDAMLSATLDIFPRPDWTGFIASEEHNKHFNRIYSECPNWHGRMEPA